MKKIKFGLVLLFATVFSFHSFFAKINPPSFQLKKKFTDPTYDDHQRDHRQYYYHHSDKSTTRIVCKSAAQTSAITLAASTAITKLLSVCGIGYCAGRVGLLDANTLSVLSKLVFNIVQPCFIFVQVVSSITREAEQGLSGSLLLLPLMAAAQVFLGYTVGSIVSRILYRKNSMSEDAKQLLACTTFGNSGPLPIVFTDAIFRNYGDPTLQKKGIAYISLYLLGWSPLFWIVGPAILGDKTDDSNIPAFEKWKQLFQRIFNPPVIASVLGLAFGCIKPLSGLFVPAGSFFNPLYDAATTIGNAYLPCVLLILTGSLTASSPATTKADDRVSSNRNIFQNLAQKVEENKDFAMEVFSVYFSKLVLMPSVSFLVIDLLIR